MGRQQKRRGGGRKSKTHPKPKKPKLQVAASSRSSSIEKKERDLLVSSDESECEGPSEYDLLMNMLGYDGGDKSEADYLDGVGDKNEVKRSEAKLESRHDEDIDDGLTGESSPSNENGRSDIDSVECGSESAEAALEMENELEMDEMESSTPSNDPFVVHFEQDLSEHEVEELSSTLSKPLKYKHTMEPALGGVSTAECLSTRTPQRMNSEGKSLPELHVKKVLSGVWCTVHSVSVDADISCVFSPLQKELFSILASYKDILFARRTFENGEELRELYLLHGLNHILKTRSKILKNNAKLTLAAKEGRDIEELRDQGLTRPKVLILVPFREAALRTVNMLISLLLPKGKGQVNNRKRFIEEYREEEHIKSKIPKPASYESMFAGNIDDCFRVGIAIKRNTVNLYSEFYSSDIIIASPLGLRTIIGAEGDKNRDYDFLSSLEVIILDQADVYLMQNWDHLLHLFDHTHLQPRESHGVDFSRVRMWSINGWSKFYRQTLIFSEFETPEINSLFNTQCKNFAGRVKACEPYYGGSISQVVVQVSHVYHRISCLSHVDLPTARFDYFITQILPDFTGELMKQTCIVIPSYFDFIRLRNHMTKHEVDFLQLSEYTKTSNVSRARTKFYHGQTHFLLYTERMHFFRRLKLRGVRHIIFYSIPTYPEFYPELVNLLREKAEMEGVTCTMVYSRFDVLALCRIVGSEQAQTMISSQDNIYTLITGQ